MPSFHAKNKNYVKLRLSAKHRNTLKAITKHCSPFDSRSATESQIAFHFVRHYSDGMLDSISSTISNVENTASLDNKTRYSQRYSSTYEDEGVHIKHTLLNAIARTLRQNVCGGTKM